MARAAPRRCARRCGLHACVLPSCMGSIRASWGPASDYLNSVVPTSCLQLRMPGTLSFASQMHSPGTREEDKPVAVPDVAHMKDAKLPTALSLLPVKSQR